MQVQVTEKRSKLPSGSEIADVVLLDCSLNTYSDKANFERSGNQVRQGTKPNHPEANHCEVKSSVALYAHTLFLLQIVILFTIIVFKYQSQSVVAESLGGIMLPLFMGRQLQVIAIGEDSAAPLRNNVDISHYKTVLTP